VEQLPMAEFFLALFIFIGVMAVTVLVFGGWIIVKIIRGVSGLLGVRPPPQPPRQFTSGAVQSPAPPGYVRCNVPGCRHLNPAGAKFCRHCGHAFPLPQYVAARRAVMA
jgi:hypothetical protein